MFHFVIAWHFCCRELDKKPVNILPISWRSVWVYFFRMRFYWRVGDGLILHGKLENKQKMPHCYCVCMYVRDRSCTSEWQLKVNCRKKFGLVCQLLGRPNLQLTFGLQFTFSCNSLVPDPGLSMTSWPPSLFADVCKFLRK